MLTSKQQLKDLLAYERSQYGLTPFSAFVKYYFLATEQAVIWHWQKRLRLTEYYHKSGRRLRYVLSRIKLNRLSNRYCLHIPMYVAGRGLRIMHLGSILCNSGVRMGENVALHINTAFVARGTSNECPTIGNNCVIGVGATILGGGYLADGIAVGAHALVNKTFDEPNIAIAGVPAKKISDNGRSAWGNKTVASRQN